MSRIPNIIVHYRHRMQSKYKKQLLNFTINYHETVKNWSKNHFKQKIIRTKWGYAPISPTELTIFLTNVKAKKQMYTAD